MYAGPYAAFEPDLCFILTGDGAPCGYVLGTRDSAAFSRRTAADWFPILRERYPLPAARMNHQTAHMIRALHRGYHPGPEVADYPAHLHIDILPAGRHSGNGSKMMTIFLNKLRELCVPAVHLGVGSGNQHAIAFYERMGFHVVVEREWGYLMGISLG